MTRLLLRARKDPFVPVCAESTHAQGLLNTNIGNQLFQVAVHRTILRPGTEVVVDGALSERSTATRADVARTNAEFDAFVLPLANAFRPAFRQQLSRLTAFIERLQIPVVVPGVGVQAASVHGLDALAPVDDTVRAFVSAVLDRSASVGVRGEVTAAYLRRLGFPDDAVEVIGCPSLFLRGPGFRLAPRASWPGDDSPLALSCSPGVPGLGELCHDWSAQHPRLELVGQDSDDLGLVLWGQEPASGGDPGLPRTLEHQLYREGRVVFPLDASTWVDHLRSVRFAVGTRLHGSVAALLAGTPAMLLTHDSRTHELAEHHAIPHLDVRRVPPGTRLEELHARYEPDAFDAGYDAHFARYLAFLGRNGVSHAYAHGGGGGSEFDRRLDAVTLPPLVRPLPADLPDQVRARLGWLHAAVTSRPRRDDAYRHPYPHPTPSDLPAWDRRISSLPGRLDRQRRVLDAQARRLHELETQLRELQEQTARRTPSWRRRVRRRLDRGLRVSG